MTARGIIQNEKSRTKIVLEQKNDNNNNNDNNQITPLVYPRFKKKKYVYINGLRITNF